VAAITYDSAGTRTFSAGTADMILPMSNSMLRGKPMVSHSKLMTYRKLLRIRDTAIMWSISFAIASAAYILIGIAIAIALHFNVADSDFAPIILVAVVWMALSAIAFALTLAADLLIRIHCKIDDL
jgi:hypothetical protein